MLSPRSISDCKGPRLSAVNDLEQCGEVWRSIIPREVLTDLWEVRMCFQRHFQRPPLFLIFEDEMGIEGLLPLSWIHEKGYYGYFPGETWQGKTWLEQNRFLYSRPEIRLNLLEGCLAPYYLRYLNPQESLPDDKMSPDEMGYLFFPPRYEYQLDNYFQEFSPKSRKQILREVDMLEKQGVEYRHNHLPDLDLMVELNLKRFGINSYFHDLRFRGSFYDLARLLNQNNWLRLITVLIRGEPAAVDLGCVYRGVYTVLAGGTDAAYPAVAKLINLYHLRWACREKLKQVDFLCGDFHWKKIFHLTPRPLFQIHSQEKSAPFSAPMAFQAGN